MSPVEIYPRRWIGHAASMGTAAIKALVKRVIVRLAGEGDIPAALATWLIQRGGLKDA